MIKTWNVVIEDTGYKVELKNNKIALINGREYRLKDYKKKTGLLHTEFELPLGTKPASLIVRSMSAPQLVIDDRDCETGEEYVPLTLPVWAYVFVVLHCANFLNGALGAALAVIGIMLTMNISCNKKINVAARVLLNVLVIAGIYFAVLGVAFLLSGLLG